jgi:MoaD family protein
MREMLGRSDEALELGEGATVGELLQILRGRASNESMAEVRLWQSLAVAVNREYVTVETALRGGDEVAVLPPVSGGCYAPERGRR